MTSAPNPRRVLQILVFFSFMIAGCVTQQPQEDAFDASKVVILVAEKTPSGSLEIELREKQLKSKGPASSAFANLSFTEILQWVMELNKSGFFQGGENFQSCVDCPNYSIQVKAQGLERKLDLSGRKLSGPAETLVTRLKQRLSLTGCRSDSDCAPTGCMGVFCKRKGDAATSPTLCENAPDAACYRPEGCQCVNGECSWSLKTLSCVESAATERGSVPVEVATALCKNACLALKRQGINLDQGPCVSDYIAPGWACDIVHAPRIDADDDPHFACPRLLRDRQSRVVEVDGGCNVILAD